MNSKEIKDPINKENPAGLSLLAKEYIPTYIRRRVKSEPIPNSNFSFLYTNNSNDNTPLNNPSCEDKNDKKISELKNECYENLILSANSYGFKGRSPYTSSTNANSLNEINSSIYNNKIDSKQKRINGFIFTELKDKVFEYRCSVCNYVAHDNSELYKHLVERKHFIYPRKNKKGKKQKMFHSESRLNQTFVYSSNKSNKFYEKKLICQHCSKKFESNYALNTHLNAHKFKCDICFKLFNHKEDLIEHKHNIEKERGLDIKNSPIKKKNYKYKKEFGVKKDKIEIDDWEEVSSNKKEKIKEKNNELEESYVFIEDNDENIDFNKMIKINDGI